MANYTNKSFNTATYTNKYGVQDGWFYDDVRVTYDSNTVTYNYFGTPSVYTNKVFLTNQELLIDDTYSLLIDDTYSLLAQAGAGAFTNKSRQSSTYTNKQISNSGRTAQELLIDNVYELLIDGTYSLEIQDAVGSQVYTNKIINN